jgi:5-methylthioribose kinase
MRAPLVRYVFSKCYREAERAATLREDATFMAAVEALKAAYRGEIATNLALCHGDLHAGSVMVAPGGASVMRMASGAPPIVKVIDPEFAIYGPPGLDLGCLFSSYVLAALARSVALGTTRDERARELGELRDAVAAIWEAYTGAMSERGVPAAVLEAISADAAGFAGCEVARTALGFAGVRGLPIEDADVKAKAEATALDIAVRCIRGRSAGVAGILAEIEEIAKIAEIVEMASSGGD